MNEFYLEHQPMPKPITSTKIKIEDIDKIYLGQGKCCRCGCGGDYTYLKSSGKYIIGEPEKIERMVNRFLKNFGERRKVTSINNYIFEINVSKDGETDRVMTIYLNQPK
jgi:hypothetical protein